MAGYCFEILETVEEPEAVYDGGAGECIAVREVEKGAVTLCGVGSKSWVFKMFSKVMGCPFLSNLNMLKS